MLRGLSPRTIPARIDALAQCHPRQEFAALAQPCLVIVPTNDRLVWASGFEKSTGIRIALRGPHGIMDMEGEKAAVAIQEFVARACSGARD